MVGEHPVGSGFAGEFGGGFERERVQHVDDASVAGRDGEWAVGTVWGVERRVLQWADVAGGNEAGVGDE